MRTPPVIWSVAGTDSGGGAGLAADLRAADAFGVHLCPVVAAVTAQNSQAVTRVQAIDPALLDAQLSALAQDMPPAVIKTGLLGSADNARMLVRWIDRLRKEQPVALVVDPVLRATTGADFVDAELLAVYRDELLPRADVITPNRREALVLLGELAALRAGEGPGSPALARDLQRRGARSVCITGGDGHDSAAHGGPVHDWLLAPQARGWLTLPRIATLHDHGTGCTFASALAAALALGHGEADAAVLAKMATAHALRFGRAAGRGAGPVLAAPGFGMQRSLLPTLSIDEEPPASHPAPRADLPAAHPPGLYAIVDSAERVQAVLSAGVRAVQLRIKQPAQADAGWLRRLRSEAALSIEAAQRAGAMLYINDHWSLALELGAAGVHLGQEDLLALEPTDRRRLQASAVALGLSSHSPWELCRAISMSPAYVACGPVWPTETKQMPWRPQGLHNLGWWCAVSPVPVVAIGGVLEPAQARLAAQAGAAGVCVVRGLGDAPQDAVPRFAAAWEEGVAARAELATSAHLAATNLPSLQVSLPNTCRISLPE